MKFVTESNGDSIEFSLSIAKQRVVGLILAWSLAFLQITLLGSEDNVASISFLSK